MKNKPDKLMNLLIDIAQNMKECGDVFSKYELSNLSDLKTYSEKIK